MRKVIILKEVTDSMFDIERLRIPEIESRGYEVEVWSLESLCYPTVEVKRNFNIDAVQCNLKFIQDKWEYKKLLHLNRKAIFFDMMGQMRNYPNKRWMRVQLAKEKCQYYIFFFNPLLSTVSSNIEKNKDVVSEDIILNDTAIKKCKAVTVINNIKKAGLFSYIKMQLQKRIIDKYCDNILESYLPKKIFLSTSKNKISVPAVYWKASVVYTHSWDYEQYLSERDNIGQYKENMIVFIDNAITHHPDWNYTSIKVFETEDLIGKYYSDMCHFFDRVEEKYGSSVVIAAHPRSSYKGNEFGDRKIIMNRTHELIANAQIVLTSLSASISYVTLYQKPFILIDNDEVRNMSSNYKIAYESFFNKGRLMVEDVDNLNLEDYVVDDVTLMQEYVRNYVVEDMVDKNKKMWEIVFDNISQD